MFQECNHPIYVSPRVYNVDHSVLDAFSGSVLYLVVGLPHDLVKQLGANVDHTTLQLSVNETKKTLSSDVAFPFWIMCFNTTPPHLSHYFTQKLDVGKFLFFVTQR